jgi:hypothetical protein
MAEEFVNGIIGLIAAVVGALVARGGLRFQRRASIKDGLEIYEKLPADSALRDGLLDSGPRGTRPVPQEQRP